jgi:hypothetical protein
VSFRVGRNEDVLGLVLQQIRGADGNSLLRFYDQASAVLNRSVSQQERARADRVLQRITRELDKRNLSL